MLRRKPTALTISPEDLSAFEDHHARKLAYLHYRKTGEDPQGLFSHQQQQRHDLHQQYHQAHSQQGGETHGGNASEFEYQGTGMGMGDPSDELKPLPGDKARIVRSREERIVGAGAGASAGGGGGRSVVGG